MLSPLTSFSPWQAAELLLVVEFRALLYTFCSELQHSPSFGMWRTLSSLLRFGSTAPKKRKKSSKCPPSTASSASVKQPSKIPPSAPSSSALPSSTPEHSYPHHARLYRGDEGNSMSTLASKTQLALEDVEFHGPLQARGRSSPSLYDPSWDLSPPSSPRFFRDVCS